jgi:RHS repeat-associated protein
MALFSADPALAQASPSRGWAGIVAGSNDYNNPVPYATSAEACQSFENSFVPAFGFQVYGLINTDGPTERVNPNTGAKAPSFMCVMDAHENGSAGILSFYSCTGGYKYVHGACLPASYPVTAEATSGCDPGCKGSPGHFPSVGDPVSLSSGAKVEAVTDYTSGGPYPIEITRTYRSLLMPGTAKDDGLGTAWAVNLVGRHFFVDSGLYNIVVRREDGQESRFLNPQSNHFIAGPWNPYSVEFGTDSTGTTVVYPVTDSKDKFALVASGGVYTYTYTDENDRVDTFGPTSTGDTYPITKSVWRGGYQRTYAYDPNNPYHVIQISDSLNRTVNLTWTGNLITAIALPDGTTLQYSYEQEVVNGVAVAGSEVLTQVARYKADGTLIDSSGYQYTRGVPGTSVPLLTAVTDAKGVVVDSTTYDAIGRVLTAQGAGGANGVSIAYDDTAATRTVTNALGQSTVYTMTRTGATPVKSVFKAASISRGATATVPAARLTQYADANGYLSERVDWNGIDTKFTNDANGNETQRIEDYNGLKRTISTTWSTSFRLPTQIVMPNLTVNLTYDTSGRVTQRQEVDTSARTTVTRTWTYTWNALGLLASATGPRSDLIQTTSYTYDANGNLATVKDPLNHVTTVNAVNAAGLPTSITDQNGVATLLSYDPLGRLASTSVQGPVPATTSFVYDVNGLLTSLTSPTNVTLTYGYDAAHRLTSMTDSLGNSMVFALDALGNHTQTQIQTGSAQVLMNNSATFDSLGRLLSSIGASNQTTSYQYDANGNLTRLTDPRNAATQTAFDALNRVKQTTDALNGVTAFAYDGQGNVTSVTDAKLHATTYTVNGFGFVTQVVSPDSGTTTFTYDLAGNVKSRTDARKIVTNYTYDALDRPLTRTFPSATADNVTYVYDATAGGNYGIGRLTSVTDAAGTASFVYDAYGNRITEKRTIAGITYTTSYAYDLAGNVSRITYPSGLIVDYQRDARGLVSGVTMRASSTASPVALASNIGYVPFGGPQSATLGNGVQLTRSYDLDYRLSSVQATGAATVQNLTLSYDPASNISAIADGVSGSLSQTFQYDLLGRVTKGTGPYGTDSYTYDALGNRLTRSLVNGTTTSTTYTYTSTNTRLATAATGATTLSYTYDATGAITARKAGNTTQAAYTYNADARLATAASATLKYNAFGQRSVETVTGGGGHFLFSQDGMLLAEHTVQGALTRNYVYLNGQPLALIDSAGAVSYVLNDQLGQPQKMLNASGAVAWQRVAGIFGDTVSQPVGTTAVNPLRFPGQQHDANTGLHYNYFRDYDPATGRYLETDPIGLAGGTNLYVYVGGNPVNAVDSTGEIWNLIIGGGIGGAVDLGVQLYRNGGKWRCVKWGDVGKSALEGAAFATLGPTGSLLGRGGARAARYGYSETAGLLNRGATRFGWGFREEAGGGGSDVLRLVRNGNKTDIPGTAIPTNGARPVRDGAVAGTAGGALGAATGNGDCGCK